MKFNLIEDDGMTSPKEKFADRIGELITHLKQDPDKIAEQNFETPEEAHRWYMAWRIRAERLNLKVWKKRNAVFIQLNKD